jgi:hypothetical protein
MSVDDGLPPNAVLTRWAEDDLSKMGDCAGALLAAFMAFAEGRHLANEYKPLRIARRRLLHESRCNEKGLQLRLIFAKVRPRQSKASGKSLLPVLSCPIRLVGLTATVKKSRQLRDGIAVTAWHRLQIWLDAHPAYELDGSG